MYKCTLTNDVLHEPPDNELLMMMALLINADGC